MLDRTIGSDGFVIRRAATERRVPCFTSLDTAGAAIRATTNQAAEYRVLPLPDYRNAGPNDGL